MTKRIGYARVSTAAQDTDTQVAALKAAGCDEIFLSPSRPEQQKLNAASSWPRWRL